MWILYFYILYKTNIYEKFTHNLKDKKYFYIYLMNLIFIIKMKIDLK